MTEASGKAARPFAHLHCHSHYSLLDGASPIGKLVARAKSHGMNALALTDHGNLHGALEFYRKAKENEINPILGYEAYVAPGSRFERDAASSKEAAFHLTLLAKNRTGFKNLIRLASAASLEGFYFKPRIDKELLAKYSEGIICLSGCVSSEFSRAVLRGTDTATAIEEAEKVAAWFAKTFQDRFFVEIMNNKLKIQREHLLGAVDIANRMGLPLVATSDAHYIDRDDAEVQDVLMCISTGKFRTDTNRMKMENSEFYLRSPDEMYEHFQGLEDAVARSQEIADSVDIDLELGARNFPSFAIPKESGTSDDYLRELCLQGLRDRYSDNEEMCPNGELSPVVLERLDRELSVIRKLGFSNYFLIVWDFVRHAREINVPATARGSGVGALVCYALYLSHVCPIKYDLLFERFLDESRIEAPDIDIDFCQERRGEIIRYVKEKYGDSNVAQIGTFGTLKARGAIKDVGRTINVPLNRVVEISEMVPDDPKITVQDALKQSEDLRKAVEADPVIKNLFELADRIEGMARSIGTHAAAVVIADKPLTEYVPLLRGSGKDDVITQWSMGDVEAAGLLKMDFLGLRNLTILSKAVDIIERTRGVRVDPLKFPLDDKATFELLRRGETKGVFQLESGGIRDLLQRMKPDHFRDIIATNALYRPGPLEGGMVDDYIAVKLKQKEANYLHPILREILEETNGVMVYQEQVMRILNRVGGIELAKAYTCIKAISKKKQSIIEANAEKFLQGAQALGLSKKDAEDFWKMILDFAGYGFNKSHSTAYALIAYQTAYLKAHYKVEFMAALLTGDIPNRNFKRKDSLVEHLEDCQRMKIVVEQPNVNASRSEFSVTGDRIQFGLSAIKGCSATAAEAIARERDARGEFKDIFDLCNRVDPVALGRTSLEALVRAGALDCFKARRSQLIAVIDKALQGGAASAKDKRSGQLSLFEDLDAQDTAPAVTLPDIPEFPEKERLAMEKEVLGYYLSSHPLAAHERLLKSFCTHNATTAKRLANRTDVWMGGVVSSIKLAHTRNPKPGKPSKYANFDLEDLEGIVRSIAWPDIYEKFADVIQPDAIVLIRGRIDKRGEEEINLIVDEVIPIQEADQKFTSGIHILFDENRHSETMIQDIQEILRGYPGEREVTISVLLSGGSTVHVQAGKQRVAIENELRQRLDDLLGEPSHRLIFHKPKAGNGSGNGNETYRKR
ncbi:MAG: DNA polymerase III subunit alpha [Pirellula sp.]|nr:DNA polymerase III subunit alpha [Pirellula sp.]